MSTECCGTERDTPFCPTCGKRIIAEDSLTGLLMHVRRQLKIFRKREARIGQEATARRLNDYGKRQIKCLAKSIKKWSKWEMRLFALLATHENAQNRKQKK